MQLSDRHFFLETERLTIRRFSFNDGEDLFEFMGDPEVVEFEPYPPHTQVECYQEAILRAASNDFFALERKSDNKLIGSVYFPVRACDNMEIGYILNKATWRQGYASEACNALMDLAWANGVHRIYAECDPRNRNSWKLLTRLGFTCEAHFHKNVYFWKDENNNPIWKDTLVYGKLRPE